MIDIESAYHLFNEFVSKYKNLGQKIDLKYYHTKRVAKECYNIAKSLNLNEEDIKICELIGILHDIGRFEQIKRYDTFLDLKSIDHAQLGIDILKENNFISKFVKDKKTQQLIFKAIYNHNKFAIEKNLSSRENLFCKIIRDADKIDIFRLFVIEDNINLSKSSLSDSVYKALLSKRQLLDDNILKTNLDFYLRHFAMLYDLNFDYSKNIVKKEKIPDKIIDVSIKYNPHEKNKLLQIKEKYYKGE